MRQSLVVGCAVATSGLRFNFTPSMPLGIYRLAPVPTSGVRRGMFVAVCAQADAAKLGRRRGYLAPGPCPVNTELLLKVTAAVGGDVVAVSADGVAVNGRRLPHSRAQLFDAVGRRLSPWPQGSTGSGAGSFGSTPITIRSWDSRFWGPSTSSAIATQATPLLVVPRFPDGRSPPDGPALAVP